MSGIGNILLLVSLNFYASPRSTTGVVGEPFYIDVTIENGHGIGLPEPTPPTIPNFSLAGKSSSTSTSISIINGKVRRTYSRTYTYTYIPERKGEFTIPPFTLTYKGKTYRTEEFLVTIVETEKATEKPVKFSPIFIRTELSRKRVYRGEGILLEYKLYSRKRITGISIASIPTYDKFWKEDVYTAQRLSPVIELHQGLRYYTITLKRLLLYPLETGTIRIPAPVYDVQVESQDFFDIFGKTYSIKAEAPVIKVLPLPEPEPEDFTGGVGEFTFKAYFEKDTVMAGEGVNLVLLIKGEGNIRFITAPEVKPKDGVHVYSPEEEVEAEPTETGEKGEKRFKYLVICTSPGIKMLNPISVSYFSPKKRSYVRKRIAFPSLVVYGSMGKGEGSQGIKGTDIAYIKTNVDLEKNHTLIPGWLIFLLGLFITLPFVATIYDLERRKGEKDKGYARLKKLPRLTKRGIRELKNAMQKGDKELFLKTLHKLLLDFVKHKYNVEAHGMTIPEIQATLRNRGADTANIERFIKLIRLCEEQRFTPSSSNIEMGWLLKEALEVIDGLA